MNLVTVKYHGINFCGVVLGSQGKHFGFVSEYGEYLLLLADSIDGIQKVRQLTPKEEIEVSSIWSISRKIADITLELSRVKNTNGFSVQKFVNLRNELSNLMHYRDEQIRYAVTLLSSVKGSHEVNLSDIYSDLTEAGFQALKALTDRNIVLVDEQGYFHFTQEEHIEGLDFGDELTKEEMIQFLNVTAPNALNE